MARSGLFQDLSTRERTLILAALVVLFTGAGLIGFIYLETETEALEERISLGADAISTIRDRSKEFIDSQKKKELLERAIKANDPKIQTAIDAIARKVEAASEAEPKQPVGTFDKVLKYDAGVGRHPVVLGQRPNKKGGSAKKEGATDYLEISQPVDFSRVRFVDLVKFWEQIENPQRLMYISKVEITKTSDTGYIVFGKMNISTFVYMPQETEEEEEE